MSPSRLHPQTGRFRLGFTGAMILWLISGIGDARAAERAHDAAVPASVIESYLRAVYARDFTAAYSFVSAEDRRVRDLERYLQQRGPFSGFALEVARTLSKALEVETVRQRIDASRAEVIVRYRVPDPKKIAPVVHDWNAYQLNSLSSDMRAQLIDRLEKQQRAGLLDMTEGAETFELIREEGRWRIYLRWTAGVRIPLRLELSKAADLEVNLSKSQVVLQPGELFEIELTIRNRGPQSVTARIGHLIEPKKIADYLDFVQCGFLLPVTIAAGQKRTFSGTYMLRGSLPEGVRQLDLTYDFRLLE
jgi:hypothetical protein